MMLTFRLPGDTGAVVEGVWLDAVELDYAVQGVRGDEALWFGRRLGRAGTAWADLRVRI